MSDSAGAPTEKLSADDRLDLAELMAKLCQALDFSRPSDFVDVFIPQGVYQATTSVAAGEEVRFRHEGADQLRAFAHAAAVKRAGLGRHWTGNIVLRATDAGAAATSYALFVEIDPDTRKRNIAISGVHEDEFVRTPAGWRFVQRTVVADL